MLSAGSLVVSRRCEKCSLTTHWCGRLSAPHNSDVRALHVRRHSGVDHSYRHRTWVGVGMALACGFLSPGGHWCDYYHRYRLSSCRLLSPWVSRSLFVGGNSNLFDCGSRDCTACWGTFSRVEKVACFYFQSALTVRSRRRLAAHLS